MSKATVGSLLAIRIGIIYDERKNKDEAKARILHFQITCSIINTYLVRYPRHLLKIKAVTNTPGISKSLKIELIPSINEIVTNIKCMIL